MLLPKTTSVGSAPPPNPKVHMVTPVHMRNDECVTWAVVRALPNQLKTPPPLEEAVVFQSQKEFVLSFSTPHIF